MLIFVNAARIYAVNWNVSTYISAYRHINKNLTVKWYQTEIVIRA